MGEGIFKILFFKNFLIGRGREERFWQERKAAGEADLLTTH